MKKVQAKCVFVINRDESGEWYQWKVLSCPYCGKVHFHGAGASREKARDMLGHRSAHCVQGNDSSGGYYLVDEEGDQ